MLEKYLTTPSLQTLVAADSNLISILFSKLSKPQLEKRELSDHFGDPPLDSAQFVNVSPLIY